MQQTYVLNIKCPDRVGIVAAVTGFLAENSGWITEAHHHSDDVNGWFFMRQEVRCNSLPFDLKQFRYKFAPIAEKYGMQWHISDNRVPKRTVLMVSQLDHCLSDIFHRWRIGEYHIEIPCVISNHSNLEEICAWHGVPFHHLPIEGKNRAQTFKEIERLIEQSAADLIVLARFMQIIPPEICANYANKIINIHHGFLPSFGGAKPYHQANHRGVKLIGATCHYVTDELDAGPIIEQDVVRVDHGASVGKMVRLGRDVERMVLSRGLRYHLEDRVIVHENKTVVFA